MILFSLNTNKRRPGYYSCGIDCLGDLFYYGVFMNDPDAGLYDCELLRQLHAHCMLKATCSNRDEWSAARETLWDWVCGQFAEDFVPKGKISAGIDMVLHDLGKSQSFGIQKLFRCSSCIGRLDWKHQNVLLITHDDLSKRDVESALTSALSSANCRPSRCCGAPGLLESLVLPKYMLAMLPMFATRIYDVRSFCDMKISDTINLFGSKYNLVGGIRTTGDHFTPIVKFVDGMFYELDNLQWAQPKGYCHFAECANKTEDKTDSFVVDQKSRIWYLLYREDTNNSTNTVTVSSFSQSLTSTAAMCSSAADLLDISKPLNVSESVDPTISVSQNPLISAAAEIPQHSHAVYEFKDYSQSFGDVYGCADIHQNVDNAFGMLDESEFTRGQCFAAVTPSIGTEAVEMPEAASETIKGANGCEVVVTANSMDTFDIAIASVISASADTTAVAQAGVALDNKCHRRRKTEDLVFGGKQQRSDHSDISNVATCLITRETDAHGVDNASNVKSAGKAAISKRRGRKRVHKSAKCACVVDKIAKQVKTECMLKESQRLDTVTNNVIADAFSVTDEIKRPQHDESVGGAAVLLSEKEQNLVSIFSDSDCSDIGANQELERTTSRVAKCTTKFFDKITIDNMSSCAACQRVLFVEEVSKVEHEVNICERLSRVGTSFHLCKSCYRDVVAGRHPNTCFDNNLDPGSSSLLEQTNYLERRCLNLVSIFMTVITLPGGQFGEQGQCIHFPNNLSFSVDQLPAAPSETHVLLVGPEGDLVLEPNNFVRCDLVYRCLLWLYEHNNLFRSANTPSKVSIWYKWKHCENYTLAANFVMPSECGFIEDEYVAPSFQTIRRNFDESRKGRLKKYLHSKSDALNSFREPRLEERGFVAEFPLGTNDFDEPRPQPLTLQKYLKSRLLNSDKRWRKSISYVFWALNKLEQDRLQSRISIALKTESSDGNYVDNVLKDSSYTFFRGMRGSVGYWNNALLDLLAKIRCIGPPTFYFTLSVDDLHWPDMQNLFRQDNLTSGGASEQLRRNPVMACKQFRRRWREFMNWLKQSEALGVVLDTFERVEFQERLSPHLHGFIWVKDAPDLSTTEGRKQFPAYLDKYVSTQLPSDPSLRKLVEKYQIHKHTDSCLKGGRKHCRYEFPRNVATETKLLGDKDPLARKKFYETMRSSSDTWVNAYNPDILRMWQANMDIQFVGHAYGVAAYVCSYIAKAESKHLSAEVKRVLIAIESSPQMSKRQILSKFGTVVLTKRCVGACEAVFRILGILLLNSTRATVFVNCRPANERYKVFYTGFDIVSALDLLESCDIAELEKYCHLGMIEFYMMRPHSGEFEQMTLSQFASWYEVGKHLNPELRKSSAQLCLENGRSLRKRGKAAAIRTNSVSLVNDAEGYYLRLLMLHCPFRKECDLLDGESYRTTFERKMPELERRSIFFEHFSNEIERAIKQLRALSDSTANDIVASVLASTVAERENPVVEGLLDDTSEFLEAHNQLVDEDQNTDDWKMPCSVELLASDQEFKSLNVPTMTDKDFLMNIERLNCEQKSVYDYVRNRVKGQVFGSDGSFCVFVSGSAGVGKSFLINILHEMLLRSYNTTKTSVLRCAFTGVASANISGQTLHRTLLLPIDHRRRGVYQPLDGNRLSELRFAFRDVKCMIVDEISMVSYRVLECISQRLCELKESSAPFGGINMLCFGDFHQLRPVCDQFVFIRPVGQTFHLWNDLFLCKQLKTNMRQAKDCDFASMLGRIRVGEYTSKDVQTLKQRIGIHMCDKQFDNSIRVFASNQLVSEYNDARLEELCVAQKKQSVTILAVDYNLNKRGEASDAGLIPKKDSEAGGLPKKFKVVEGARVMLIRNLSVEDGLVNGSVGTVVSIVRMCDTGSPHSIFVKFDSCPEPVEIRPVSTKYFGRLNSVFERTQFPLRLCWACTIHKVQGLTLDTIVIDLFNCFAAAMAYVALSRVRSLDCVSFIRFSESALKCSSAVKDYYRDLTDSF